MDFGKQCLPLFGTFTVGQPFVTAAFIDRESFAHSVHIKFLFVIINKASDAPHAYFFLSFTKKRNASLRMSFASRSPVFSFISFFCVPKEFHRQPQVANKPVSNRFHPKPSSLLLEFFTVLLLIPSFYFWAFFDCTFMITVQSAYNSKV